MSKKNNVLNELIMPDAICKQIINDAINGNIDALIIMVSMVNGVKSADHLFKDARSSYIKELKKRGIKWV